MKKNRGLSGARLVSFSAEPRAMLAGIGLTLIGGVLWGCNATVSKVLMDTYHTDPMWLACVREVFAGLLFLLAGGIFTPKQLVGAVRDVRSWPRFLLTSLLCLLTGQVAYLQSIHWTNSGTATVLQSLNLLFVLAWVCVMGRRLPGKRESLGVALAFVGTLLIATGGNLTALTMPPQGLAWGLANALATSALSILPAVLIAKWGNFVANGIMFVISGLALCPFVRPWESVPSFDVLGVALLVFTVVIGTFGAYWLFMAGMMRIGSMRATMLGTVEPMMATITAVMFTGVVFTPTDLAGFALIILMVFLVR